MSIPEFTHPSSPPPPIELDLHTALQRSFARVFFGMMAMVCALGLVATLLLPAKVPMSNRLSVLLGYALLGAVAVGARRLPPARIAQLFPALVLAGLALVGILAAISGWGLQTPGLMFFGLVVCMANAAQSQRVSRSSTVLAVGVALALGWAESQRWLPAPAIGPTLANRLVMHCAVILTGAMVGRVVARLVRQHLVAADTRELRFRTLLGIATSTYWETDATLRLTQVARCNGEGSFVKVHQALGWLPWDMVMLRLTADERDLLRAEMESRNKLRDMVFFWETGGEAVRCYIGNAEPRHDADGCFIGYWGVARDITAETHTQAAVTATEARYHELFKRLPSPLTLQQNGLIVDANPAAAALLGYASVPEMLGHSLLADHVVAADWARAQARASEAELLPDGRALPPLDLTLRTLDGRLVMVKAMDSHANHAGAPAVLSMVIDETERRSSVQALQRSQAMLASVVSLSPDIIALTELASGNFVMVNDSFTRLTGYPTDEVVGRNSVEIGLWRNVADRDRMVTTLSEIGVVADLQVDFMTKQGRPLPLLISAARYESNGMVYLLLNARDRSESVRVRLEREAILNNASVGIAFTREHQFVLANAQFEQMYGWPVDTLAGQAAHVVWPSDAECKGVTDEVGLALQHGDVVDLERQAMRFDGSLFLVRLRAKAIDPNHAHDAGTIWIAEDVTRAREAKKDLAAARDTAEVIHCVKCADSTDSASLANTSDELPGPLNGLMGLARLATQPGLAPGQQRQYLQQIGASADVLAQVIADILDVAKIAAGTLQLAAEPFDLRHLLRSLQQTYAGLANAQGLVFEASLAAGLPQWVCGDRLRVRQILVNFLQNALRFTATGRLRLDVRVLLGDTLRFEVHDTGPGVSATVQDSLFEPLAQADESTSRRFGGTGLGLSICRELAARMGGRVGLVSQAGQGSCFFAELPLPATDELGDEPPAGPADGPPLREARLLLVQSKHVNELVDVALLAQWGLSVTRAADGPQALAALALSVAEGRRFDAVLMDALMPGMSGFQTTAALRTRYTKAQLPVIGFAAATQAGDHPQAMAAGMNDFLTQPVTPMRLRAALLRALAGTADYSSNALT